MLGTACWVQTRPRTFVFCPTPDEASDVTLLLCLVNFQGGDGACCWVGLRACSSQEDAAA